jgi:hypothetical protein
MTKYRQTPADLDKHLDEHIGFLTSSAESFDKGYVSEAKRMAMSLRVLLHNTHSSRSLYLS